MSPTNQDKITPIRSVDDLEIGNGSCGPVTGKIQTAFFGLFDGTTEDRFGWLDPIEAVDSSAMEVSGAYA